MSEPSSLPKGQDPKPITALLAKQVATGEQLRKFWVNYNKSPKARITPGFLRGRIDALDKLWDRYQVQDQDIDFVASEEDRLSFDYFTRDHYGQNETRVGDWKGTILDLLGEDSPRKNSEIFEGHASTNTSTPVVSDPPGRCSQWDIKLPRITLPQFSGDYKDWITFHDLFESLVHQHPSIPAVQKLHYLKSSLKGEAQHLIRHLTLTQANYDSAWRMLCDRYKNPRLLITRYVQSLLTQPPVNVESSGNIRQLMDTTNEYLAALKGLSVNTEAWDPITVTLIVSRLPADTRKLWEQDQGSATAFPALSNLLEFLDSRVRALEAARDQRPARQLTPARTIPGGRQWEKLPKTNSFHTAPFLGCPCCNANHLIKVCPKFKAMPVPDRSNLVKRKGLCFNCLATKHQVQQCPSQQGCFRCGAKHNTLLHREVDRNPSIPPHPSSQGDKGSPLHSQSGETPKVSSPPVLKYFVSKSQTSLLATALVPLLAASGELIVVRALIDPGSQTSFITTNAVQRLRLPRRRVCTQIHGLCNTPLTDSEYMVQVQIRSNVNPEFQMELPALVLSTLTDKLPPERVTPGQWQHLHGLPLADPLWHEPGPIDLVLGVEVYAQIVRPALRTGEVGSPTAQETVLGWILFGKISQFPSSGASSIVSLHNRVDIDECLRKFWEIEEVFESPALTPDEKLCERLYQETHSRDPSGRYVVKLPFVPLPSQESQLGPSREIAIRRFQHLEQKLHRNPQLAEEYIKCIEKYFTLDHAEKILPPRWENSNVSHCYLPHHAIVKADSTTTRCRVVFDASCKTQNGFSLNERLLIGPRLQQDICKLILKWRLKRFVFCADIEKMYRQILVCQEDAEFQRIIWRRHPDLPLEDFRLKTVTFPIRTLHQLALDEGSGTPRAADALVNDTYVDDVYSGADELSEAVSLQADLITLLQKGKFHLHKWSSNHPKLLEQVKPIDHAPQLQCVSVLPDDVIKTLGLFWNPSTDRFSFRLRAEKPKSPFSKRTVVSYIARLYDPLGWLSPVLIRAKIFIQTLWQHGLTWDEVLPAALGNQWQRFIDSLPAIERIEIPRHVLPSYPSHIQMHGFCDASERAYAAALYLRVENSSDVRVFLLAGKTKAAPVKPVTLPRLELCGAVLLSKLIRNLTPCLPVQDDQVFLWTDSTIVLSWLGRPVNTLKTFVSNRISTILTNIGARKWRHVPSSQNPVDGSSRGRFGEELIQDPLWFEGPPWLKLPQIHWPQTKHSQPEDPQVLELRPVKGFLAQSSECYLNTILNRFSQLNRLLRVTSYCFRFIRYCRTTPNGPHNPPLSRCELEQSLKFWCRFTQTEHFSTEVNSLLHGHPLPKYTKLLSVNPFLDGENLIRVGGRLAHSGLPYEERHPIILPHTGQFTALLVQDAHHQTLHGGPQIMLSFLRRRYWILRARHSVRKCFHSCLTCFRWKKHNQSQLMAQLPAERVLVSRPFTYVGVDYTGHLDIKASRVRGAKMYKGYLVVFVCLCTKAIHLEVVGDMTTSSFLAAFRRFTSRRGSCKKVFSDNGTNFVGAKKHLNKDLEVAINQAEKEAAQSFSSQGIEWHFIPPSSPHFGGLWEAGVKSLKYHFKRIAGNRSFVYEELITLTTQIEGCLNSRPLCPLSDDITDYGALTPAHFLIGSPIVSPPEPNLLDCKLHLLDRWQLIQRSRQEFWTRWSSEYLSRLQQRPKWCRAQPNLKTGDLVLLKDDRLPPLKWKLGRIIKSHPGPDALVRVVTVKTDTSELQRPITKVCPLPCQEAACPVEKSQVDSIAS